MSLKPYAFSIAVILLLQGQYALGNDYKLKPIRHLYDITHAGRNKLTLPTDVAVNQNYVYVVDGTNHQIAAYNHKGKFQFRFGSGKNGGPGILEYPVGMSAKRGRLYVADTNHHKVRIFDTRGKLLSSFKIRSEGFDERPIDIKVSEQKIFVTCNNSQKVQVYNQSGRLLYSWGKKGKRAGSFRYPATIDTINRNQKIVVDVLNARAQIFSHKGKFIREIGGQGAVAGKFFRPKGVAVDGKNRIYISDSILNVIQVFDRNGKFLYILGNKNKIQRFDAPAGITVYQSRLYVSEVLANKVSVFSLK